MSSNLSPINVPIPPEIRKISTKALSSIDCRPFFGKTTVVDEICLYRDMGGYYVEPITIIKRLILLHFWQNVRRSSDNSLFNDEMY